LAVVVAAACCSVLASSTAVAGAAPATSKQSGPPVSGAWRTYKSPYFDFNLRGTMTITAHHRYVSRLQGRVVPTQQSGNCGTGTLVVKGRFRLKPYVVKVGKKKVREYRISKGYQTPATITMHKATYAGELAITIIGARGGSYSRDGLTTQGELDYVGPGGVDSCELLFGLKKK
jgi:hypothetical protein